MGKKWGWLHAVRSVLSCGSGQYSRKKSRNSAEWANEVLDLDWSIAAHAPVVEAKLVEAENEQSRHAYSVALATAAAAEAAVAAAHAAAAVVRLTARNSGRTEEDMAAIKIQSVLRGYLARKAVKALRGLARLKTLVEGKSVKLQPTTTLKRMQMLGRMQSEVRVRRITRQESSALQHQIKQKQERDLEKLSAFNGEDWDDSVKSKEEREANLQHRQEAAIRRERSLAYAYSHQQTWRASSTTPNQTFMMNPTNPHWGWSWLDHWIAPRPSENTNKEGNTSRPSSRNSPSTPKSRKFNPPSPRGTNGRDDESTSIRSAQSDRYRRHSIAGSSVRDDESLKSSGSVSHRYMASTESARAKSRMVSPLGGGVATTPSGGSAKKRLSFSGSPAGHRRHSGPLRIDVSPMKDITTNT